MEDMNGSNLNKKLANENQIQRKLPFKQTQRSYILNPKSLDEFSTKKKRIETKTTQNFCA